MSVWCDIVKVWEADALRISEAKFKPSFVPCSQGNHQTVIRIINYRDTSGEQSIFVYTLRDELVTMPTAKANNVRKNEICSLVRKQLLPAYMSRAKIITEGQKHFSCSRNCGCILKLGSENNPICRKNISTIRLTKLMQSHFIWEYSDSNTTNTHKKKQKHHTHTYTNNQR